MIYHLTNNEVQFYSGLLRERNWTQSQKCSVVCQWLNIAVNQKEIYTLKILFQSSCRSPAPTPHSRLIVSNQCVSFLKCLWEKFWKTYPMPHWSPWTESFNRFKDWDCTDVHGRKPCKLTCDIELVIKHFLALNALCRGQLQLSRSLLCHICSAFLISHTCFSAVINRVT